MWFINSPEFRSRIEELQKGTTRKRISRGNLATIELPIPPSAEQARIVEAIETQFSRLDAGVAALERARAKMKRYRAAVLYALVWKATSESSYMEVGRAANLKPGYAFQSSQWRGSGIPVVRISCVNDGKVDMSQCAYVESASDREQDFLLRIGRHPPNPDRRCGRRCFGAGGRLATQSTGC